MHAEAANNHSQVNITRRRWLILLAIQVAFLPLIALEEYVALALIISASVAFIFFFNRLANGIILLPLFIFMPFEIPQTFGLQFSELGVLLLFLSTVGTVLITGRELKFEFPAMAPIVLILIGGILSMINAKYLWASALILLKHLETFVFVFFVAVNFLNKQSDIRKTLFSIAIGGFFAALLGITWFVLGIEQRVFGLHGGVYGAFIGIAIVCSVSLIIYGQKGLIRNVLIVILPFLILALLLSQTRAWTGGTFLALFYLIFSLGSKASSLRTVLLIVGLALIVFWLVQSGLLGLAGGGLFEQATGKAFHFGLTESQDRGKYISSLMRIFLWWHGLNIYLQYPLFGFGWGNLRFKNMFTGELDSPYKWGAGYMDNHYLNVLYETGIIGIIGWIWLIFLIYRYSKVLHRLAPEGDWRAISRGIIGCLIVFAFGGIFWALTNVHETTVMVPYLIALIFASVRILRKQQIL